LPVFTLFILQQKPKLGCTEPSTGPHAARGLDIAVLNRTTQKARCGGQKFEPATDLANRICIPRKDGDEVNDLAWHAELGLSEVSDLFQHVDLKWAKVETKKHKVTILSLIMIISRVVQSVSEVFGWCRRFLGGVGFWRTLGVGVGFFHQTPEAQSSHFCVTLQSWEFLLKCHNFPLNFYWNSAFLLRTTICIGCWLLQNCWPPNFIHFMLSREFWKGRTCFLRLHNLLIIYLHFNTGCNFKTIATVASCTSAQHLKPNTWLKWLMTSPGFRTQPLWRRCLLLTLQPSIKEGNNRRQGLLPLQIV